MDSSSRLRHWTHHLVSDIGLIISSPTFSALSPDSSSSPHLPSVVKTVSVTDHQSNGVLLLDRGALAETWRVCSPKETTLKVSGSFSGESLDGGRSVVTMASITCLMKCLGEEGFVKEALARMKEYHCKPDDVYAYNTIINALCRVGNFKKARFLLDQMQLPITVDMGCRKAIRRRMWEANRMFREMLFRVFAPDVVTYNSFLKYYSVTNEIERGVEMMGHGVPGSSTNTPLIHALVETRRVAEARGDGGGRVGS
ncbi:hypothetical protein DY000_02008719 [Brassica cretica]|uniref:Pentacotripeptide-repeat region of PRORP domain-containing protein n=1 Tax=Brassica cretica TaxID=69181 RepID=A0ABQ7C7Z9_BRACR|nr:hypothetical protein DY000_02008719 [Brassica cretica]